VNSKAWLMAARPRTLTAAIAPVIVGTALAWRAGAFQPFTALAALLVSVLIQIGANFANDLYDFKKGADAVGRVGPTRVTTAGLLSPAQVAAGMWLVFAIAALLGAYVAWRGGWPLLVLGAACILAGWAYTAGPFPLGYNGLGDVAVFIFFGLGGTLGTYYAQAHALSWPALWAAVPVGLLTTNIIIVNNVRDVETDRAVGKRTLAVLFGRSAACWEYALLAVMAYAGPVAFVLLRWASGWILLPLLTLPLAVTHTRALFTLSGPALNRTLGGTAQLLAQYAVLFALGLMF
jgi:1,4-dihydroxy-2-naphthoate octaprenyltransferase